MSYLKQKEESFPDKLSRLFPDEVIGKNFERLPVRTITFQVTDDCNLCCTYCYQIHKQKNKMSFDVAKKAIDLLLNATGENNEYINSDNTSGIIFDFIGGEPLLEIDLISQICDYAMEQMILKDHKWLNRHMFSMCSNGVLYFEKNVQDFIIRNRGKLSFSVSIDGNKELHDSCRIFPDGMGSYDTAMKAVEHYRTVHKGFMGSKMTLSPSNIMHTFEAVKSLYEKGYDNVNLNCVFEKGWDNSHAKILYYELKKLSDYIIDNDLLDIHTASIFNEASFKPKSPDDLLNWCGGTGSMMAIDYKGDIYPCLRYMESSLGDKVEPVIIGNVYDGIMVTEKQKECVNCMRCVDRRTQSTDECFNCPIATGCAWCSAYNYQETGSIDKRVTYICVMHKARALANIYFWNKVYKVKNVNKVFKNYVPDEWSLEIIDESELQMLKNLVKENDDVCN